VIKLSKNENVANSFIPGDFVVYPSHGVGKIIGTEKRKFEELELELLVIRFEHERMTLRVPLSKATEQGLRTLSSKIQMEEAIVTLKGKAKVKKTMWSRRAQEYETKINSGSLVSIAEVVRDLYRKDDQGEQSYSERQMYQAALERLASEFAAVDNTDKESAVVKLEKIIDDNAEEAA
jgi:CarD family transcriptional regulator